MAMIRAIQDFFAKRTLFHSPAIRDGGYLVVLSVLTNLITLVYNLYLGRRLQFADFGLVVVIASTLQLLQIPLSSYTRTITHSAARIWGTSSAQLPLLWQYFRKTSYVTSILVTVLWMVSIPLLMEFFKVRQATPFILIAPLWIVSVTAAVDSGVLLGMQRFKELGVIMFLETVLYFGLTVLLVEVGAPHLLYISTPISIAFSFGITWMIISKEIAKVPIPKSKTTVAYTFPWKFYFHSFITKFSSIAFITVDVLLAKHFLPVGAAGRYVMVAVVGKMVFYASSLFGQFVIPLVAKEIGMGKSPRKAFSLILLLTSIILMGAFIFLGIFGWFTVPLIMGGKANSIVAYLPWYVFGMCCFSLANLLVTYYQTKEEFGLTLNSIIASFLVVLGIILRHKDVYQITLVMAISGFLSLALALLQIAFRRVTRVEVMYWMQLAVAKIISMVFSAPPPILPAEIKGFTYIRALTDETNQPEYAVGIYQKGGKKYIGKLWEGPVKNESYFRLLHEMKIARFLSSAQRTSQKIDLNKKNKLGNMACVPKFETVIERPNSLMLFSEYVENAKALTEDQLVKSFKQVREYFATVSAQLTHRDIAKLPNLSGSRIIAVFPLLWISAVLASPKYISLYFNAARVFLQQVNVLWDIRADRVVHRDIHEGNILLKKNVLHIVDFSYTVFGPEFFDEVQTLTMYWQDKKIRLALIADLNKSLQNYDVQTRLEKRSIIAAMGLYIVLSLVSSRSVPQRLQQTYISALRYWIQEGRA